MPAPENAPRARGVALYIDPPSHHYLGDRLFDLNDARLNRDNCLLPYARLRGFFEAQGIAVRTADWLPAAPGPGRALYVSLGYLKNYRQLARRSGLVLSALFAMESPVCEPALYRALPGAARYFERVYSWSDGAALEPLVGQTLRLQPFCFPQAFEDVDEDLWGAAGRKHLVMINSNKLPRLYWRELYSERLRAIAYFSRLDEIDLYGLGWELPPNRMGQSRAPAALRRLHRAAVHRWQRYFPDPLLTAARRAYRGPTPAKAETLSRYTFALCFENTVLKGYITEKLFDCFHAGTVPIYLGAPDIEQHVPPDCFIDMRQFGGYEPLRDFLRTLSGRAIRQYKHNARAFLRSPQFRPFTQPAFVEHFCRIVQEDAGVSCV